MKTDETNPRHWFLLAAERLSAADVVYTQVGPSYSGVELLHEAVERYLKGYLVAKGWTLRKLHDLTFLNDEAKKFDVRFNPFDDLCENLTEQFWAQHYPGGEPHRCRFRLRNVATTSWRNDRLDSRFRASRQTSRPGVGHGARDCEWRIANLECRIAIRGSEFDNSSGGSRNLSEPHRRRAS